MEKLSVFCSMVDGFDFHVIVMPKSQLEIIEEKYQFDFLRMFGDISPIDNFSHSLISLPIDKGLEGRGENCIGRKIFVLEYTETEEEYEKHGIRPIRFYDENFGIYCIQGEPITCPIIIEDRAKVISRFLDKKKKAHGQSLIHYMKQEYIILKTGNSYIIFETKKTAIFIHCSKKDDSDTKYIKYLVMTPSTRSNILFSLLLHQASFDPKISNFINILKLQTKIGISY